jgi:H+/gluconate symporter-like permease
MQQEAENNGWLTIWHEFMWWYPWYRLHVQVFEVGQMMFDIGMSILPFGDVFDFAEEFHQIVEFFSERIIGPIVIPMIVAESVSIIAASASAGVDIAVLLVATWLAKGAAIVAAWNDVGSLGSVFLGIFVPMFFTALTKGGDMLMTLLQLLDGVKTLAEIAFGRVYRLASFIANMVITSVLLKRLDEMGAF